jgi:hypothetical protein
VDLWYFIKRANAKQIWQLIMLSLGNIRLLWPTYKATKKAVQYSNTYFGTKHHKNTPANAFRHAIWNWLIAKECMQWKKDENTVLKWTQRITAMHEKILPGDTLSNAMDMHNNEVGRSVFFKEKEHDLEKGLATLRKLTQESKKIRTLDELTFHSKSQLVHLIDPQ